MFILLLIYKLHQAFMKLLPFQGALLAACLPRVLPWARSFCPFRACCFWCFCACALFHNLVLLVEILVLLCLCLTPQSCSAC